MKRPKHHQMTTFRQVLYPVEATTSIDEHRTYQRLTIRPYPAGVSVEALSSGLELSKGRHKVARAGQLLVAKIEATGRNFGIVPSALDGGVVARRYLTFDLQPDLRVDYFEAFLSTPVLRQASLGWYGENGRIILDQFHQTPIPLPDAHVQRLVVEVCSHAALAQVRTADMTTAITQLKSAVTRRLLNHSNPSWELRQLGDYAAISPQLTGDNVLVVAPDDLAFGSSAVGGIGILPSAELDAEFLFYVLESRKPALPSSVEALRAFPLPLPTLYEQRKIAVVLRQHDAALARLNQEEAALRVFTEGMMHTIFTGTLDAGLLKAIIRSV